MNSLELVLRELRLSTVVRHAQELAIQAECEGWSFTRYLHDLVEMELLERGQRRTQKRLKESGLPTGKTLTTLKLSRLPEPVRRQLPTLCEGHFVERAQNILAFNLPGRGKTSTNTLPLLVEDYSLIRLLRSSIPAILSLGGRPADFTAGSGCGGNPRQRPSTKSSRIPLTQVPLCMAGGRPILPNGEQAVDRAG